MLYVPPIGGAANDPYVDGNPGAGTEGSAVPAAAVEYPQREILAVITGSGLVPNAGDLTQLRQAIAKMIQSAQRAVIIDAATFAGAVVGTGKAVYWDAANNRFDLAVADGSVKQSIVGFADVPNAKVYCFGAAPIFAGLLPGRYYLDAATPGAITSVMPAANAVFVGVAKGSTEVFVDIDAQAGAATKQIQSVTASVAANALTLGLNPTSLDFRNAVLTNGTPNTRAIAAALSLVVPAGATLGTISGQQARLAVLALDNAGAMELAVVNLAGGTNLDETNLINTTAISVASNSPSIAYSAAARVNVPFRVVEIIDITEAVAGTWASAPTMVQGAGGQALTRIAVQSMVRLYGANGYGSTNPVIRRFGTTLVYQGNDITFADSATLGSSFTINTSGVYSITYTECYSTSNNRLGISLNSSQLTTGIDSINAADRLAAKEAYIANFSNAVSWTGFLPAGSVIRPHNEGQPVGATPPAFTIARVQ